ncbi:sigma factor-like helix-turn-helix DNA-binding protein [Streptomyces sp. NPDC024017]|uniref:RNA polymerase sigma factor n=1 Tax=Streptomyces sp. NPDC024017 TaxID=3154326 RepID=UPI0033E2550E
MNAAALAAVFRNEAPRMTALAARLLRESEIPECVVGAEDVVQTAFEKVLGVQGVLTEPRAYVYTTLRREVSSWAVRLGRERQWEIARRAELRTSPAHGRDIAATVTDRIIVRDGIRSLPGQQAAAVVATKMYGFTQHETAQLTGRRPGTVAVHVARAVATLLLCLTPVAFIVLLGLWWGISRVLPFVAVGVGILGAAGAAGMSVTLARGSGPSRVERAVRVIQDVRKYRAGR